MASTKTPMGYIELSNGSKAIYPMNDIFLNYTFEKAAYWETLRTAINILIEAYALQQPKTKIKPIQGIIEVKTQYQYLLDIQNTTKDQDIKIITPNSEATYIEFQNRARPDIPIEIRSVEYFGLGIGHSKGKLANQIWLLAEDVEAVLHGQIFARYVLKDEATLASHPTESGILYVSLAKLSQEDTPAGELASFLLGKATTPRHNNIQSITQDFISSFNNFKSDKEAVNMLSLYERAKSEGRSEGRSEGWSEGRYEGRQEGWQEGRLEGINIKALTIARNMKIADMDVQLISKLTGLTLDEVNQA